MSDVKLYLGDCLEVMRTLEENSVQCCVTSPPYWALRDYDVPPTDWPEIAYAPMAGLPDVTIPSMTCCLGLEPDPLAYVGHLVAVFREARRVLRRDGTLWLNLGDTAASPGYGGSWDQSRVQKNTGRVLYSEQPNRARFPGLKQKDLCGIPWRCAFALQADGWWLRSDIIWHKPNCMPESAADRPTRAHDYLFLLAKSARYYYDASAIKEPASRRTHARGAGINPKAAAPSNWATGPGRHDTLDWRTGSRQNESYAAAVREVVDTRNKRDVWSIGSQPFPGAHYATFPEALVEPCIRAGTSERGCCPRCGSPWRRVVVKSGHINRREAQHCLGHSATKTDSTGWAPTTMDSGGWSPTCACDAGEPVPCAVLDPFSGTGTTLAVASRLRRNGIGIDLSAAYVAMAEERLSVLQPILVGIYQ